MITKNQKTLLLLSVLLLTVFIHSVFCIQLFKAVPNFGLVLPQFGWVFYPHTMLMYFLAPYPFHGNSINWPKVYLNMVIALPASVFYAAALTGIVYIALRSQRNSQMS